MRLRKYFEKRCKELGLNFEDGLFQEETRKIKRPRLSGDVEENDTSESDDDEREVQKKR